MDYFKAGLRKNVEVIDLGELHQMLGIEEAGSCCPQIPSVSESVPYIDAILHCFNCADTKPLSTPTDVQEELRV